MTSAVIPFPKSWNAIPRVRVTVSIDGLQPEHDARRAPATYEKILKNLAGRKADVSWVITNQMMERAGYLEEYLAFWTSRSEIERIWLERLHAAARRAQRRAATPASRARLLAELPDLKRRYPALILPAGAEKAFAVPPRRPTNARSRASRSTIRRI